MHVSIARHHSTAVWLKVVFQHDHEGVSAFSTPRTENWHAKSLRNSFAGQELLEIELAGKSFSEAIICERQI